MSAPNATMAMLYQSVFTTLMTVNYTIFPDGDGVPHLVKLDYDPLTPEEITTLDDNLKDIVFTLYTKRGPPNGQILKINDRDSISRSDWNGDRPTIMSTHGWRSGGDKPACTDVRDEYLKLFDANVIIIDWSVIAGSTVYPLVAKSVPRVAAYVAEFVNFLRMSGNLDTKQLKMAGHSLGGHVASLAARIVKQSSLISEVIAFDPAGPMFEDNGPEARVDRSHADHVQVIHTNAGKLGLLATVGTSDFYANGGKSQPGCGFDLFGICAHSRSYEYYSESIGRPKGFPGKAREGAVEAFMGGPFLDAKARGYSFDFETRDRKPWSPVPFLEFVP